MPPSLARYRECAAVCAATLYDSEASIKRHNAAADDMRRIAESHSAADLLPLLEESLTANWLAFQLLEIHNVTPAIKQKCLTIIGFLASGSTADSMGARMWLSDYMKKNA